MTREIKFRAWNGKYMIDASYGDWISFDGVPYTEAEKGYDTPHIEIQKAKNYILMQFTGLVYKGQEIYESDLISLHGSQSKFLYVVKYEDAKFVLHHVNNDYGKWGDLHRMTDHDFSNFDFKLVGNIYENPELLK